MSTSRWGSKTGPASLHDGQDGDRAPPSQPNGHVLGRHGLPWDAITTTCRAQADTSFLAMSRGQRESDIICKSSHGRKVGTPFRTTFLARRAPQRPGSRERKPPSPGCVRKEARDCKICGYVHAHLHTHMGGVETRGTYNFVLPRNSKPGVRSFFVVLRGNGAARQS